MVEYNPLCSASVWLATTWCCASTSTVLWLLEKCETMTPVAHLSLIQARRLALRSLAPEFQSHSVPEVVRRLGYVQIDTIAVVERAHHHVLWTRLPTYETSQLDRAQGAERQILEYWSHAAAYLPMEDYRFCLPRMAASRHHHAA